MQREPHVNASCQSLHTRGGALLIPLLGFALLIAGVSCSRSSAPTLDSRVRAEIVDQGARAKRFGWTEQADALSDGVLTDVEVDSLHSLYRECMAEAGAELSPAHRSPVDGRTWFEWETNFDDLTAADNEPIQECGERFRDLMAIDLRPKPMDAPLRRFVAICLADLGIELEPDDQDIQEIYRSVGEANVAKLGGCITSGIQEEYPEIEGFSWGPPDVY